MTNRAASALARQRHGERLTIEQTQFHVSRLRAGGWTMPMIRREFGVTIGTIYNWQNGYSPTPIRLAALPDKPKGETTRVS